MHVNFPRSLFKSNLKIKIQSTVCRHSPAGVRDRGGCSGSWICLQSKGEKVKYTVMFFFSFVLFDVQL